MAEAESPRKQVVVKSIHGKTRFTVKDPEGQYLRVLLNRKQIPSAVAADSRQGWVEYLDVKGLKEQAPNMFGETVRHPESKSGEVFDGSEEAAPTKYPTKRMLGNVEYLVLDLDALTALKEKK